MKTTFVRLWVGILALGCAIFSTSIGFAAPIQVDNASFETLPVGGLNNDNCGPGCMYSTGTPIPGWMINGGTIEIGQFQPGVQDGNLAYFNFVPDGITVAYSNGGSIFQKVGPTVEVGVVYKLQVELGFRKDSPDPGFVELVIGDNAPIIATSDVPAVQFSGDWLTYTAIYKGVEEDFGKSITIELFTDAPQGDWDNVRLDATSAAAVPEPGTIPLIGAALVALVGVVRRKRVRGDLQRHAVIGI